MQTPKRDIFYKNTLDVIRIKPVFDVHLGARACDVNAFKAHMADSDDNTYFLFGGDLFDSIIATDPRYRKSGDGTVGDEIIDEQVELGYSIIEPYKDRILGMASGNHEDAIAKRHGTHPIKRLCRRIGCPFLGYSGLFRLQLKKRKKGKLQGGTRKVVIRYHHGWGGGSRTQGADLTKFSKDILYWQADVFLYGHVHRKQTDSIPRLGLVGNKLVAKPKIIAICGTFLKTYNVGGDPTYSEIKGYPPVMVGAPEIHIRPQAYWVKIKAID